MNNIIQNNKIRFIQSLRDVVFGLEGGVVSTRWYCNEAINT